MGEVDDVEQAEADGEPERQQRIERAVDQSDQQLPEQSLRRYAEDLGHGMTVTLSSALQFDPLLPRIDAAVSDRCDAARLALGHLRHLTSGQPPSASGRNAWSAGIVARTL